MILILLTMPPYMLFQKTIRLLAWCVHNQTMHYYLKETVAIRY